MRVGLLSDTHDNLALVAQAADFLRAQAPDLVLHLGDVTEPETLRALAGLPVRVLLGNNDDAEDLSDAARALGLPPPAFEWEAELDGVHVAAHHGHLAPRLTREPDVLLHGHTHRRRVAHQGRTLVVNPGALHRAATKTIAMLELPSMRVAFFRVDREGVREL